MVTVPELIQRGFDPRRYTLWERTYEASNRTSWFSEDCMTRHHPSNFMTEDEMGELDRILEQVRNAHADDEK